MSKYQDFSSLPPAEEQSFIVYEQHSVENGKKAMLIGIITSAVLLLVTTVIVFSYQKPMKGHQMANDDLGALTAPSTTPKTETQPTETQTQEPPAVPVETTPAPSQDPNPAQ